MRFLRPIVALVTLLSAAPLAADTVVTMKSHTDAVSKRVPAEDEFQVQWFGADGMRFDDGDDSSVIMRTDLNKAYMANHKDRSYIEVDLPIDLKAMMGAAGPMMERMLEMIQPKVSITETDRTGSYGGYDCRFVRMEMTLAMGNSKTTSDSCVSGEVPIDYSRYEKFAKAQADLMPQFKWMEEMMSVARGFPVRTETTATFGGKTVTSWTEIEKVEEKDAPAGTYEPPAGYKKTEFNPMAQAQQGR